MEEVEDNEIIPADDATTILSEEEANEFISSLTPGEPWEDPDFPADDTSLCNRYKGDQREWKRPKELVDDPRLFVDEGRRTDVIQGRLADCWLMAACSALAMNKTLLQKVLPGDQSLSGEGYTGLIRVRLWRFGEWVNILIDDRLPSRYSGLLYGRCSQENEFWLPLLEKAYAKMCHGYENLSYGNSEDGLVDLTGGIAKVFRLSDEDPEDVFKYMHRSRKTKALISAGKMTESGTDEGLVASHAYTISYVARIKHEELGAVNLVRLRNPWGKREWQGEWSDSDHLWEGVSEETKQHLKYKDDSEGEFWMNVEDFCEHFTYAMICNLGPDYDDDGAADQLGEMLSIHDSWKEGDNAGGPEFYSTYETNPQFLLTVEPPDEVDSGPELELLPDIAWAQVTVLQKSRKGQQKKYKIKLCLYKVDTPEPLTQDQLKAIEDSLPDLKATENYIVTETGDYVDAFTGEFPKLSSGEHLQGREAVVRMELPYGHYVILPCTKYPNEEGDFMIRVFLKGGAASLTKLS